MHFLYSQAVRKPDEIYLCRNAKVEMWSHWHSYQGKQPLRSDGRFFVITDELYKEFDEFRKLHPKDFVWETYLEENELLSYWLQKEKISKKIVQKYGKKYIVLGRPCLDTLCEWVTAMRNKYADEGPCIFD